MDVEESATQSPKGSILGSLLLFPGKRGGVAAAGVVGVSKYVKKFAGPSDNMSCQRIYPNPENRHMEEEILQWTKQFCEFLFWLMGGRIATVLCTQNATLSCYAVVGGIFANPFMLLGHLHERQTVTPHSRNVHLNWRGETRVKWPRQDKNTQVFHESPRNQSSRLKLGRLSKS